MKRLMTITALMTVFALSAMPTASSATRDTGRPRVSYETERGQYFFMSQQNPLLEHKVRGVAYDRRSKVSRVIVVYRPCASSEGACELSELRADAYQKVKIWKSSMSCTERGRHCEWALSAPSTPGHYQVKTWAFDVKGNKSTASHTRINVV